jgi:Ca2+-binding RTX toxin-like protein
MTHLPRPSRRHLAELGFAAALILALALAQPVQGPGASGPKCFGKRATIVGTAGANTLNGTGGRDVIMGLGAADKINARGGNDLVCGGKGGDKLRGGDDDDDLHGQKGNDDLFGDEGFDDLFGEQGLDGIDGGRDADDLRGGDAQDALFGGRDADRLFGDGDEDRLFGEQGDDELTGGPAVDECDPRPGPPDEGVEVRLCESDLSVDVSGPATAPAGVINFTVTVKNEGPSPIVPYYLLVLTTDNSHLQCTPVGFTSNGQVQGVALAEGESAIHSFQLNCTVEGDPPRTVFLDARVVVNNVDHIQGNESDRHTTTVN